MIIRGGPLAAVPMSAGRRKGCPGATEPLGAAPRASRVALSSSRRVPCRASKGQEGQDLAKAARAGRQDSLVSGFRLTFAGDRDHDGEKEGPGRRRAPGLAYQRVTADHISELAKFAKVHAETARAAEATMPKLAMGLVAAHTQLRALHVAALEAGVGRRMTVPLPVPIIEIRTPEQIARSPAHPPSKPPTEELAPDGNGEEIMLQGFNWESHHHDWYAVISSQAEELAAAGFSMIWLPPPTDSVSPQGYMPRDLYDLNSNYGSLEGLQSCIRALQGSGIKVIGDVVLNHRCAHYQDSSGVWNKFGGRLDWDARAIVSDDPHFQGQGHHSTGDCFHAAPNIDHQQQFVRDDISQWLRWLRWEIGFDGWRLDFARGFHGRFVGEYMEKSAPEFAVGEYWDSLNYNDQGVPEHNQNGHRQRIVNWINATGGRATAFDVTTKGILHSVFERHEYWRLRDKDGKPPGVMGWWPSRATTFLENHDTGSTQGHWRFPDHGVEQGYAYILTHPGTPTVFYDHWHDQRLKGHIQELMALRRKHRLGSRSSVHIHKAERDFYAAEIDNKVVVKLGPGSWSPNHDSGNGKSRWSKAASGRNWAIWEMEDGDSSLTTPHHHHQ